MLVRCIADGCESTTDVKRNSYAVQELKKVDKITFHTFPSDPVRRAEWIRILRLENKIINTKSRVCSLHFEEKYMDRISYFYPKLRKNAVPHIFEKIYNMDTDKTVLASPKFLNTRLRVRNDLGQQPATFSKCDKETNTTLSLLPETRKTTEDKETRISPERVWSMNFSHMEAIRKESGTQAKQLRKRITNLKRQIYQKDKKISDMKAILGEFKVKT